MVKLVRMFKTDFYKNDDDNGGAMAQAIENCQSDQIVIHSQTKKTGRIWGCMTPDKFVNLLDKNNGLYEVITKFPHKAYFDIDGKVDKLHTEEEFKIWIDTTLSHLTSFFPNAEYAISGSNTDKKISLHIILQNYVIHNENERQYVKHLAKYIHENLDSNYDWKVYTKNRNMKCINQSKDDGRIQSIITNPDYKAHCITCFVPDYSLPFQDLPENVKDEVMIEKSKHTFDLGQLPKLILSAPDDFDILMASPLEILQMLPLNLSFDHNYTHLIARFCYYNDLSFDTFLSWLNQKHETLKNEIVSKWNSHWNKLEKFPPVSKERIISILKYYYPHITKDIHYRKFAQTFDLPSDNIEKIETISKQQFNRNDKKYLIFNVGMGGGKTAQTISFLKEHNSYLWIAPNRALATNTHKRFEAETIDVCHYESINTSLKKQGNLKEKKKLIVCLNSLHYITGAQYDILIIDEIETLVDKFLGDFLEQGKSLLKRQIWTNFVELFKKAKTVILLDAFITTKTLTLIQQIENTLQSVVIYERKYEPQTRTIKYMDEYTAMLDDIIKSLNNGNKLFIFYPYKNRLQKFASMEQIYEALIEATGKKGIFYNADVDDNIKQGLKDVNASWKDANFIITNNIITCGVNYENMDFDYKYIFIASHNTPRDIIQVSYRARHLNSTIIKICYMGKMNQNNTWLNDCDRINCPIYNKIYNHILIEKKAPIKRAFQLFCVKARYKQEAIEKNKVNQQISDEINKLLDKHEVGMSYNTIPDIDHYQAHEIEEKCFAQEATMLEKYAFNKYFFKQRFLDTANKEILAQIWDEKFVFFFERLAHILSTHDHLFNDIAKINNLTDILPIDVKKMKLDEPLKERIFKLFSFKYINSSSATIKIIKEIYNTYFGKHLITCDYLKKDGNEKGTHISYNPIDTEIFDYIRFAKSNLILNAQHGIETFESLQVIDDDFIPFEI
jgi:hypothetical protein